MGLSENGLQRMAVPSSCPDKIMCTPVGSVVIESDCTGERCANVRSHSPELMFQIFIEQSTDPDTRNIACGVENILRHITESKCPLNVLNDVLVNLS